MGKHAESTPPSVLTAAAIAIAATLTTTTSLANQLLVPQQYPTIQEAVDATIAGDTVVISPGTWYENIVVPARAITLASTDPNDPNVMAATILDGSAAETVISLTDSLDTNCTIAGLTITNGQGGDTKAGGINCPDGFATIENCHLTENKGHYGGSVFNDTGNMTVINCSFENNTESSHGSGIYSFRGELTCINCYFADNLSTIEGAGIASDHRRITIINCIFLRNWSSFGGAMHNSHYGCDAYNCLFAMNSARNGGAVCTKDLREGDRTMHFYNCTFYDNYSEGYGGAISLRGSGEAQGCVEVTDCILWDNDATNGPEISSLSEGSITVSYSCVQGGDLDVFIRTATVNWLEGNISADPLFADPTAGDLHLQSTEGRWDPNIGDWVLDDADSPAIDAGDPNSDWTAEPWPNGQRINMGAYGGAAQASKTFSPAGNIADIDASGSVNSLDLQSVTDKWLAEQPQMREDLNADNVISMADISILLENWGWRLQK